MKVFTLFFMIDQSKIYSIEEAIQLAKDNAKEKFDASLEVHLRLGIDPSKGDQQVRSVVVLPHGTGKTRRIAVFSLDQGKQDEASAAGADVVGGEELIEEVKHRGSLDAEVAIATHDIMPKMAQIARILGPRGLMPSPKNETIREDIAKAVGEMKGGKVAFKNDDTANVHQIIGRISWEKEKLIENFQVFIDALKRAKPASSKGTFVKGITVATSMGKGIRVSP